MSLKGRIATFLYYAFRVFPIKQNKIVVDSYAGKGFGDNGKYIVLELLKRNKDYDIVWLARDTHQKFPKGIRVVPYISLRSIYEQVTAKVWIDNLRKAGYVRKRDKQYYIMTWHGTIATKKIEAAAEDKLDAGYIANAKNDAKMTNLMLASSDFEYTIYKKYFWYDGEIMKNGVPRADILFQNTDPLRNKILSQLGLAEDTHIFLYAPTFRNNMTEKDLGIYKLRWKELLAILTSKFGGKWVGFVRLHPNISRLDTNHTLAEKNVYDVTDYPDMQELLAISDMELTDYSSSIYEFALTGKPGFILASDLKEYQQERGMFFDLHQTPFPIAESQEELLKCIETFDKEKYHKELHRFYHEFCGSYPGGHASEIVANRIDDVITGKFKF